jgi:hypothetical protein
VQEVVLSREVAREVIRCITISARTQAGVKVIDAAKRLGIPQPVYSRFELVKLDDEGNPLPGGQRLPDEDKLAEMMTMYGAADRLPILMQIHKVARHGTATGHHTIGLIDQATIYIALEPYAQRIEAYEQRHIPGLLQKQAYAEALIRRSVGLWPEFDTERALSIRLARAGILTAQAEPVRYTCYLDESVLYRMVIGGRLFVDQLEHLLHMSELSNVQLRIVPLDLADSGHAGVVAPTGGPLTLVQFTEQWVAGYTENDMSARFHESTSHVQYCGRVMGQYDLLALSEEQSRDRIRRRIRELEDPRG